MGSAINLTCVISHSPEPPAYIFWYHNGKVMSYDSPRGGVTVMTDHGNSTTGYLLIQESSGFPLCLSHVSSIASALLYRLSENRRVLSVPPDAALAPRRHPRLSGGRKTQFLR
ncbi:hypothetical protein E2C01_032610 [Portunus trituberculatus]|uniref:Ig-like domain-containing protein n=1 Tax=Portunus trituberculatus TaxID=210409 RepID=A0A5B7EVQ2_PORTR|nr:hypothetical protein [Portunus trituberculatus]